MSRILLFLVLILGFSIASHGSFAQDAAGAHRNKPQTEYQPPKEVPKPRRVDRLNELLPIIRGIYANTNRYSQRRHGFGEDRTYTYFENVKPSPEEAITLQNLDDIANIIDFLKSREARSVHHSLGPALPRASLAGFHKLWPDDVHFVLGPGLKGCNAFCRQMLLEAEFASITVLETEIEKESAIPQPFRATRYSLDPKACKTPRDGYRLTEGEDETLNLPHHPTHSARPALGLCFGYEAAEIPENGAFVYFNHASPYWPDEFEKTYSRTEFVPDPLRAIERIVNPKAFEGLETEFELSFINHIVYEFRAEGLENKTVFAYESACIKPRLPIGEGALNLLISTHEASEDFVGLRYSKHIFANQYRGICTGRQHDNIEHRLAFSEKNQTPTNIEEYVSLDVLVKGAKESLERFKKTEHHLDFSDLISILPQLNKSTPTQTQIDALVPIYESMFDNITTAHWAIKQLQMLPEGSLAGHLKSLNRIRDKIANNAGCNSVGCKQRYHRVYDSGPNVNISQSHHGSGRWVPKSDDDKWIKIAGDGASIYAAAGPKAIKHLEAAHKKGLGGGVYAMGCIGASSEMLEAFALQTVRSSRQMYPQPTIRHFLSIRHSSKADEYKKEFLKQKRVSSYYNSHIRAILAWDNKSSLCRYRNEI